MRKITLANPTVFQSVNFLKGCEELQVGLAKANTGDKVGTVRDPKLKFG